MLKRILTAVIGIILMIPFLVFSHTWALVVMTSVLAVVGIGEILKCTNQLKNVFLSVTCFAVALTAQILAKVMPYQLYSSIMLLVYAGATVILLTFAVFSKGKISISDAARSAAMTIYVSFGFSSFILLRSINGAGLILFLLAFFIPWVCDAMAYFVGVSIGKHKLIPDVSPKKTVEGAIGGVVFCILAFVAFACIYNQMMDSQAAQNALGTSVARDYAVLPVWFMAVVGLLSAVVSMIGDLSMSVIKRHFGIKDYGKLLPGHGGFLDRFDSVLAVSVILAVAFGIASGTGVM